MAVKALASTLAIPPIDGMDRHQIVTFLRAYLDGTSESAGRRHTLYVLGLSGGIDSAVTAALALQAVGPRRVLGLLLHAKSSGREHRDAVRIAEHLGLRTRALPIDPLLRPIASATGRSGGPPDALRIRRGNAAARLRMLLLYDVAAQQGGLVLGSGNKSELLVGYFTKHGDGGVDLLPLGDLFKTQVRSLAEQLGLPAWVIRKPPTAGLWPGQTDESELAIAYEDLDRLLRGIEVGLHGPSLARAAAVPIATAKRVEVRVRDHAHKRRLPLIPKVGVRSIGSDWRE